MKSKLLVILTAVILFLIPIVNFGQTAPTLGATSTFALFTGAGAFNELGTLYSTVTGDVGTNVGAFNAFPPGTLISGTKYLPSSSVAVQAATDVATAYSDLTQTGTTINVLLSGQTLTPGVYTTGAASSFSASGVLTLNGEGNPDALFIIRIGGALTTGTYSSVILTNSASPNNVYWQINGAFSLGDYSVFVGTIVAVNAIELLEGSSLIGRGLSREGAITLHHNIVTLGAPPATPSITLTQPTCTVSTGTITVTAPTGTGMTYSIDGSTYTNTTGIFTGVATGSYNVTAKNSDGYVSPRTSVTINTQPSAPAAATASTTIQPTCAVATGTIVVTAPVGAYEYNIDGGTYQSSVTFTGISAGSHNILVRRTSDNTCISTATVVTVNTQPTTPTAPTVGTITQPTCVLATGSVVLSGLPATGTWTLTRSPGGTTTTGTGTSSTITGLSAGTYTYTVTDGTSGCTSVASANVVIIAASGSPTAPTVGTITQPTCTVSTGSVVISGLPSGNWTINPGSIAGTGTSTTISGLAASTTYNYIVTNSSGCISVESADVVINSQPVTPAAPLVGIITQPTCSVSTGSVVLSGLPAGSWTINPGSITGNTASTTISGLAAGTHNYTVTNSAGCTSAASANVVINAQPATPTAPVVGTRTQPTCAVSTGSVVLSGLPSGSWTINPGAITGSTASTTISSLTASTTYNFTVTNAVGCISAASADVVINSQPVTPAAPLVGIITQPTCSVSTGSVVLSGLPSGSWTINPGAITGSTASITISGLAASTTYNYTVTNSAGCTSAASANVVINAQPATVSVSNQTTSVLSGETFTVTPGGVPVGTTYTWTAPAYTGGVTGGVAETGQSNIHGTLTIPSGTGTAIYTVTPTSGSCVGATFTVTVTVVLACVPVSVGTQPADNSMCMTSGSASFTVSADGAAPFTYQWQYNNAGTWANVANGTPSGAVYSNQTTAVLGVGGISIAGSYQYRSYITNCSGANNETSNAATLTVNAVPTAPAIGTITQLTCSVSTGSVVLTGLPATGTWTINPGSISGTGTSTTISGLVASTTYNYIVTNSSGCISAESADVVIAAQPATPAAPLVGIIVQPTCAVATGSVLLSGLPSGNWTINPGPITGNTASTTISGLTTGTHNYTVTNAAGCTSAASANVVISAQLATPSAPTVGTITQPTCAVATGSVVLSSLPSGNWIINPGSIAGSTASITISGLAAGTTYHYTVTNAAGCISAASADVVTNAQPVTPAAPLIGIITQPACAVATGRVVLSGLPSGNWIINPGTISGSTASTTISGLATGTHNYTVTNAAGCTSAASANVVINAQPATPAAPTASATLQPTCTVSTGTITITAPTGTGMTYSIGGAYQASATFSEVEPGTYTVTAKNSVGCISQGTSVTIDAQPASPAAPTASATLQPTCIVATGTITVTAPTGTGMTYSIGSAYQSSATFSSVAPGTYTVTAKNDEGCISTGTSVTINAQPATPATPTATLTQPTCTVATGTITVTAPTGTGISYSIGGAYQSSATFNAVAPGTYTVTAKNATGCISTGISVTINAQPATPAAPTTTLIQPTCTVATGTITVTAPTGTGITYSIGGAYQSSVTFSSVTPGTYTVTAKSAAGCVSSPSTVTIVVIDCSTDLSIINTVDNIYPLVGRTVVFTVVATNNGPNSATGVTVNDMLPAGYTYVSSTTTRGAYVPLTGVWTIGTLNNGASEILTVTAKVNPTGNYLSTATITGIELDRNLVNNVSTAITYPTEFFIPEGFSPNGDGINDLFVIRGINYFPDNEFVIFNRWGNKVFEANSYQNTWDGRSTRGLRVGGDELPIGTYFYLLDLGDGSKVIKGTIYLNR